MAAPKEYIFYVKMIVPCQFLKDLNDFFNINNQFMNNSYGPQMLYAIPKNGYHMFEDIQVWVVDREKNSVTYLYFKCKEDYNKLIEIMTKKKMTNRLEIKYPIYRYEPNCNRWNLTSQYSLKKEEDLIGYDHYINMIEDDLKKFTEHKDYLVEIGENNRSLNYLLYGPPGTGKTSLVKLLASKHNFPIFIINAMGINSCYLNNILSPQVELENNNYKIILFEDFDRFLENKKNDVLISNFLNALDGLDDKGDTIRFLTGNNEELILQNEAMSNRMNGKFQFYKPTKEMFHKKLSKLLSIHKNIDNNKLNEFLNLIEKKNITFRPFVNYTIRYLFKENYMDELIQNIDQLK
ncbi:AAA family ATPase [uncultured virus]|nr:AAA family ATPase [uncultured virus]